MGKILKSIYANHIREMAKQYLENHTNDSDSRRCAMSLVEMLKEM